MTNEHEHKVFADLSEITFTGGPTTIGIRSPITGELIEVKTPNTDAKEQLLIHYADIIKNLIERVEILEKNQKTSSF